MKIDEMKDNANRFRLLFENAPMPYQSLDEHGIFLDVNNKWLETLGYENKNEIIGDWFSDYLTEEYKDIFDKRFPIFKHACMIDGAEFDMIRKDGTILTVSFNGRIQQDEDGQFVCTHCIFHDITKSLQINAALHQSEQRYRRLSDATFESIFISENGICIEQNATAEMMFGYTHEEAAERDLTQWFHPDDREIVKNNILSGREAPYEVTALRKDGTTFPCEIQGRTATQDNKTIRITALRDLTDRINAEKKLRDSEQRHRLIFEHSPLSVIRFAKDGRIVDCNRKFVSLMGSEKDRIIGFNTLENSPADMRKALKKAIQGSTSSFEDYYTSVTGSKTRYIRTFFNPVDPDNVPTEVIAIIEDISDRKKVENKLAASEERFRLMAENAQDVIYRFSIPDERYEYISQACRTVMGYEPEEFYSDYSLMRRITLNPWREQLTEKWPNMVNGNILPVVEFQITDKSGQTKWLQQTNVVLYNPSGKAIAVEGIIRDITELKNALENLEQERARAEAASNTKSEFLANMSHEIRTPLNGILGMLQLMQDNSPSPKQSEYISAAMQASKRLNSVLSDILDLARVESGKLIIRSEDFNPAESLHQVLEMFEITSKHSGVELNLHIDPSVPQKLHGDALRLQQVLSNLVGNAIKFTESGSVSIAAQSLPTQHDRPYLLFTIEDTGIGIPDEKLGMLFDSFTQIGKGYTRQHQGVGLGLAICKRLISLMGGNISVDTEVGRGTTFYISIPFAPAETPPTEEIKATHKKLEPKESELEGCKILIAEDEKVNRLYTKRFLEQRGCTVETAVDGQQTLDILMYNDFDLILMDVQMPVMNGIETTEAIRKGEAGAHNKRIPIIAVTAYAMTGDKDKFVAAGMNDYIAKPVEESELYNTISKFICKK
ncbi:PAS domain S-box protein [Maridesulfovibrio hydrothermalis]|uniref:histidine kinase n=1 Tax=Maridesulfovibrio hydrothermalis AM13 = DSM 14728 TaxID=1121451 RepID=L0RB95_9BACT|nr:PAS domain S-box protein [Maridesulfovibrio hydrothermalis]CCO23440.1 PAS/PAC sensor hybrid histidine kinase (modular protein) [Maridesulfovibrio hydrothermalis AM13 = DSM 14728]